MQKQKGGSPRRAVSDMNLNGCSRKLCPMQVGCTDYCRLTKEQCPYYTQDIDVQKALNLIKAEVVREIVEEIERYLRLNEDIAIRCKEENGEQNEEYWKGKISAFRQIRAYIEAELKKKYTEQKND